MTATNVRCVLVASGLAVLASVLAAAYLWRGYSHPAGEPFNKNEWSVVQGLQLRSKEMEFRDEIRISPNVSNSGKYDAIGLPRLDGQGWVWVISNAAGIRSEEHTSELQSLMRISYAVFCLKKKNLYDSNTRHRPHHMSITHY